MMEATSNDNHREINPRNRAIAYALTAAGLLVAFWITREWMWDNEPVHSAVEAVGAVASMLLAYYLLLAFRDKQEAGAPLCLALGFIGMGVLDMFHAFASPGPAFVFLHSLAGLVGGVGFASVLLPARAHVAICKRHVPVGFALLCSAVGLWSLVTGRVPTMLRSDGAFSALAVAINVIGGVGYLVSLRAFSGHSKPLFSNREKRAFLFMALFFGIAGVTFSLSALWDGPWWLWHVFRLFAFLGALFVVIDGQHRNHMQTGRAKTRFRTLYESSSDAMMMLSDTGFTDCNVQTLALFGIESKEAFCRMSPADLSPPEQADGRDSMAAAGEAIETAMREGSNNFEWLHKRHDTGEVFPAEVLLTRMELEGQQVLQASVRDITERKRTEELLRAREARWSALTDNFEGIIQILGTDGTIKFMSRVYPPHTMEDVVGKSAFDFMDEGSTDKACQALKDVVAGSRAQAFEITIRLPDGAAVPFGPMKA